GLASQAGGLMSQTVTCLHGHEWVVPGGDAEAGRCPACGGAALRQIGPYRIFRRLGRGRAGTVYLAHDTLLDRQAVLRTLPPSADGDGASAERLERRARAAALEHPGLCPVWDAGEVEGVPYVVAPYVRGKPLPSVFPPGHLPPPRHAAALVR